jgi:hypothetical protein
MERTWAKTSISRLRMGKEILSVKINMWNCLWRESIPKEVIENTLALLGMQGLQGWILRCEWNGLSRVSQRRDARHSTQAVRGNYSCIFDCRWKGRLVVSGGSTNGFCFHRSCGSLVRVWNIRKVLEHTARESFGSRTLLLAAVRNPSCISVSFRCDFETISSQMFLAICAWKSTIHNLLCGDCCQE